MRCAHCSRRIKAAAATLPPGVHDGLPYAGGPVGPVCARKFGLLQVNPRPSLFLFGVPVKPKTQRAIIRTLRGEPDPRQLELLDVRAVDAQTACA